MIFLLTTSLLTLTTLADLDSITDEWIAPGTNISKETVVEFAEHGPMFQGESEPYVGSHVTFVEVDGEEKWRAVVVYTDRVVLFQEDQQPVVTLHSFPVETCTFSGLGNFVVLHDGASLDNDQNALRVNTETTESSYFDSELDGLTGRGGIRVWNNGAVLIGRALNHDLFIYRVFFLSPELSLLKTIDTSFEYKVTFDDPFYVSPKQSAISCVNSSGDLLWEEEMQSMALDNPLIVNNERVITPTYEGIEVRSLVSGRLVQDLQFDFAPINAFICGVKNSSDWYCLYPGQQNQLVQGNIDTDNVSISDFYTPDNYGLALEGISKVGFFFYAYTHEVPKTRYYVYTDTNYNILMTIPSDGLSHVPSSFQNYADNYSLSSFSHSIAYSSNTGIQLISTGGSQ